jgi:D-aminoacyl-tRNA deacylase
LTAVRAVVQTVSRAAVRVDGEVVGAIEDGLLVLLGVTHDDTEQTADTMARKVYELRILDEERSAAEAGAPVLVVSQFTLYGDARKGRRPTWAAAAPAEVAEPLVTRFAEALRARGAKVATGRFRAHMLVESVNVGPRTVVLEL